MQPWLELGGVELVSGDRAIAYASRCGCVSAVGDCECEQTPGFPFVDPETDAAPWVRSDSPDSLTFQGVFPTLLEVSAAPTRSVAPTGRGGASVGRMRPRHRLITVRGLMVASEECGLAYGRKWLADALAGGWRVEGCASDVLRVLPCCPEDLSPLVDAVAFWKAEDYSGSGNLLDGSGGGRDAVLPAAPNKPLWLPYAGVQHLRLPGVNGNAARSTTGATISGDFELAVDLALDSWRPAANKTLITNENTASTRGAFLYHLTTGFLQVFWSENGTALKSLTSSVAMPTSNDGQRIEVKVTLDVDNGAGGHTARFYWREPGAAWTQLGTDVVGAGTTLVHSASRPVTVGAIHSTTETQPGRFYGATIKNGIDGTVVASPDFTNQSTVTPASDTFTDAQGNVFNIIRTTTGLKAEVVNTSRFALGTDDYLEIADHATLNPGTGDFTAARIVRVYNATPPAVEVIFAKKVSTAAGTAGWALYRTTTNRLVGIISDGVNQAVATSTSEIPRGFDDLVVIQRDGTTLRIFIGSTQVASADASLVGNIDNTEALRVGRLSGAGTSYGNFTDRGGAYFDRALTEDELGRVAADLEMPGPPEDVTFLQFHRVGIVDGPEYSNMDAQDGCWTQEVYFVLAAGNPYLWGDQESVCLDEVALTAGNTVCCLVAAGATDEVATLVIEATADTGSLEVTYTPTTGGVCPAGEDPEFTFTIPVLNTGDILTVDSVDRAISFYDASETETRPGLEFIDFEGVFQWFDVFKDTNACVCVEAPAGAGASTVTVSTRTREL